MGANSHELMPWPDPDEMSDVMAFYGGLKDVKEVSTKSCRDIEVASKAVGHGVGRTTIASWCDSKVKTKLPPSFKQVEGFLLACGLTPEQVDLWRQAYVHTKKLTVSDGVVAEIVPAMTDEPVVDFQEDIDLPLPQNPLLRMTPAGWVVVAFLLGSVAGGAVGALFL